MDATIEQGGMYRTITFADRDAWLSGRSSRLTASNIAAALGISPYKSRLELYAEIIGAVQPDNLDEVERVRWGTLLQPLVTQEFARKTGRRVADWPQDTIAVSGYYDWLACTPDATQLRGDNEVGVLEIKTTGERLAKDWKDEPPLHVQIQAHIQAWILGASFGTCACLVGGQKLVWHDFDRNDAFVDAALPKLEQFWQMVQSRTMPEPDSSDSTARVIAKLFPLDDGETIQLPHEATAFLDELTVAKEKIKELETSKQWAENRIKSLIGSASFAVLDDGRALSLKTTERKEYICPASTYRTLREIKSKK